MDLKEYILDFNNDSPERSRKKIGLKDEAFELFCDLYMNNPYGDLLVNDNLIEIHTGGWSDNEHLIYQLKKTGWWINKHIIEVSGGHYYLDKDRHNKDKTHWKIEK